MEPSQASIQEGGSIQKSSHEQSLIEDSQQNRNDIKLNQDSMQ